MRAAEEWQAHSRRVRQKRNGGARAHPATDIGGSVKQKRNGGARAHPATDIGVQCETMLMRLGMGSGLKGFGGLERSRRMQSVTVLRPLLDTRRVRSDSACMDVEARPRVLAHLTYRKRYVSSVLPTPFPLLMTPPTRTSASSVTAFALISRNCSRRASAQRTTCVSCCAPFPLATAGCGHKRKGQRVSTYRTLARG